MKVGDLVKISCTCGKAHDKEPLIGVVVGQDDNTKKVEVLVRGMRVWMLGEGLEVVDEVG